jgi:hypothetical protein
MPQRRITSAGTLVYLPVSFIRIQAEIASFSANVRPGFRDEELGLGIQGWRNWDQRKKPVLVGF